MLGAFIEAEMNNIGCPWGGGVYAEEQLEINLQKPTKKFNSSLIGPINSLTSFFHFP